MSREEARQSTIRTILLFDCLDYPGRITDGDGVSGNVVRDDRTGSMMSLREEKASKLKGGIYHRTRRSGFAVGDYKRLANEVGEHGYLHDTCLTAQNNYKALLDYFKIKY